MSINAEINNEVLDIQADLELVLRGDDGLSAYEVAVKNGFAGTEAEWLASLKGEADRAEQYTQEAREYRDAAQTGAIQAGNFAVSANNYRDEAQAIRDGFAPEVANAITAIQAEKEEAEQKKQLVDEAAENAHLDRVQADADATEVRYLHGQTIIQKNVATDAAERARRYAEDAGSYTNEAKGYAEQAGASENHVETLHEEIMRVPVMTEEYTKAAATSASAAAQSAQASAASATSASDSATLAGEYRDETRELLLDLDTTVEHVSTLASATEHKAEIAENSAEIASNHADTAVAAAENAMASSQNANTSARAAEQSAQSADASAQAAHTWEISASTAAQNASASAQSASDSAQAAEEAKAAAVDAKAAAQTAQEVTEAALDTKLDKDATAVNAEKVNGLTVETAVPPNAVFTDTTYEAMTAQELSVGTNTTAKVVAAKIIADYVTAAIAAIINTAPAALDTLSELADALGDDPNFATTVMTEIGKKLDATAKAVSAGNADTVNGLTVKTAVPENAVFTDTTYTNATTSTAGLMSAEDKAKLDGVEAGAKVPTLTGVKGGAESTYRTGNVNITKANIGLGNVDNTADKDKAVASAGSAGSVPWSGVTGKPTTISGYGITDAPTKTGTGASGTWNINVSGNAANADTVNGLSVESAVPANAKFTDTTYTAASATPKANGTAAVGTSAKYAREDHVHPLQTSVSGSSGSCTGNAATATKATGDKNGNDITTTYANLTGTQTISGTKTFTSSPILTNGLTCRVTDTNSTITRDVKVIYANSSNTSHGINLAIGGSGNTIIGGGESYTAQLNALEGVSEDDLYLIADRNIYLKPNCNTFADAKTITINTSGEMSGLAKVTATSFVGALTGNVTGNVSGSSGSCTGNAATATKAAQLTTERTIDGVKFNGTSNITHYGICSTAAATVEKVVACTGFALATGAEINVKFTVTNTATNPTLNVNSTGAKAIYYRGAAISAGYLAANRTYRFVYNGTQYELIGDLDTNTNNATAQNISTANDTYPILLGATANATANIGNKATIFGKGVKVNPSTSEVVATEFTGALNGNAATATNLKTARYIDGVSFNGTADITHYGTCSTAAATAAKTVSVTGFKLVTGASVKVKFTATNTAANPTLNVNSTGAKAIYSNGSAISAGMLSANTVIEFVYDGTHYNMMGGGGTTYNIPTQSGLGNIWIE